MPDDEQPLAWYDEIEEARRNREAQLTVGQRVRVDFGECPHYLSWHGSVEQNQMGSIINVGHVRLLGSPDDHPFMVLFDRPIPGKGSYWAYGAAELVPITTEEWMAATLGLLPGGHAGGAEGDV